MPNDASCSDETRPLPRPTAADGTSLSRRFGVVAALAALVTVGLVGIYILLRILPANGVADDNPPTDDPPRKPILFAGWGRPDLVLVVSGQMHGYINPCGCSEPQYGGLVRRQSFMDELRAKGWDAIGIDLGELASSTGIQRQRELKLEYTMKALDVMGYKAVGIGKNEMVMPLTDALVQFSAENANPRPLASSLAGTWKKGELYHDLNVRPFEIVGGENGAPRVGVLSMTGPNLEDFFKGNPAMSFLNNKSAVLPRVFKEFAERKVDLAMLMHHDYPKGGSLQVDEARRQMANACAQAWEAERKQAERKNDPAIPPLHLLMVLTEEPEPPAVLVPVKETPTQIIEIGHKGKYVGVVGIFRKETGLVLKYELVRMEPSLDPAPGQKNRVLDLLEEYTQQVKKLNLLAAYLRTPHAMQVDEYVQKTYGGTNFVGSGRCGECHVKEFAIWGITKHANAFNTLVLKAEKPKLRQYDPECVVCHTVGFRHPEGYNDLPRFMQLKLQQQKAGAALVEGELAKHNQKLEHVGCENCHGPGSAHANKNPNDPKLHELMNPFRPSDAEKKWAKLMQAAPNPAARQQAGQMAKQLFTKRMDRLDQFCQKCHDLENDVHWAHDPFLQKWVGGGIVHNSPGNVGNQWLSPPAPAEKR
jgi:2',3'-cyclic-nucleotide 2'-phosphodiesterase (5'-nucleotidase family)